MQIDFYCEFPEKGLEKLKLIKFPSRIFIADIKSPELGFLASY